MTWLCLIRRCALPLPMNKKFGAYMRLHEITAKYAPHLLAQMTHCFPPSKGAALQIAKSLYKSYLCRHEGFIGG